MGSLLDQDPEYLAAQIAVSDYEQEQRRIAANNQRRGR